VRVIGDLNQQGIEWYTDDSFKYKIRQDSHMNIDTRGQYSFFFGLKHKVDGKTKRGKIITLKEYHQAISLDLVEIKNNTLSRSYTPLSSLKLVGEIDSDGLVRNILNNNKRSEFFKVLELISGDITNVSYYNFCVSKGTHKIVDCTQDIDAVQAWSPKGGWGAYQDFDFFEDFFKPNKASLWEQMWRDRDAYTSIWHSYKEYGFNKHSGDNKNYNFINDIRPSHEKVLNYRWHYGGYELSPAEMKVLKPYIYQTFQRWYPGVGISSYIPLVKHANSNSDVGFDIGSIYTPYEDSLYKIFNGKVSTKKGVDEIVFPHTTAGYIYIDFKETIPVYGIQIRIGTHDEAESDKPVGLQVYASKDKEQWDRVWHTYNDIIDKQGEWITIEFGKQEYRYFTFEWLQNNGGHNTRISDLQWLSKLDDYTHEKFQADEQTVRMFTNLSKIDTLSNFLSYKMTIETLLGDKRCVRYDDDNECTLYGYGGTSTSESYEETAGIPKNIFITIANPSFEKIKNIANSNTYEYIKNDAISADDAFYVVHYYCRIALLRQ